MKDIRCLDQLLFLQLYINKEFVGGCDIVIESFQNGELQEMLEVAMSS